MERLITEKIKDSARDDDKNQIELASELYTKFKEVQARGLIDLSSKQALSVFEKHETGEVLFQQSLSLTGSEVALQLGVNKSTISRAIDRGWLQANKVGRQYFISQDSVVQYQETLPSLRNKPGPKPKS